MTFKNILSEKELTWPSPNSATYKRTFQAEGWDQAPRSLGGKIHSSSSMFFRPSSLGKYLWISIKNHTGEWPSAGKKN